MTWAGNFRLSQNIVLVIKILLKTQHKNLSQLEKIQTSNFFDSVIRKFFRLQCQDYEFGSLLSSSEESINSFLLVFCNYRFLKELVD